MLIVRDCKACVKMLSFNGLILLAILCCSCACRNDCLTIGIIANGSGIIETESITRNEREFKLVKHLVDTTEVYQVFRLVHSLDADPDVDVIMLLDYDNAILMTPQALETRNKPLIKMGGRDTHSKKARTWDNSDTRGCEINDYHLSDQSPDDIYCKTELNITQTNRDDEQLKILGPRALGYIINSLEWTSIIILYESSTEFETTALVDDLSRQGVLFALFNVEHVDNLQSLLKKIYRTRTTKEIDIVVLCRFHCTKEILQNASRVDSIKNSNTLLTKFSRWLILLYGHNRNVARVLQNCANDLYNVAVIAIPEFSSVGIESVCNIIECTRLNTLWGQNPVLSDDGFKEEFIRQLQKCALTWNPSRKCRAFHIDTLLWTTKGREFSSVGYADINGDVVLKSNIFPNAKYGYNKRSFLISTLEYKPFVIKRKVNNSDIYEGFCMDLLKELANRLNFTYNLTEPADGKWGSHPGNFTFNGLVGQLQREEVDIVAAPISIQAERSLFMDYSYSYYYEYTTVVVKKPNVNATKWRTLVDPFRWEVLVAIGVSLVTVTILAFLLEKYNPFYEVPQHAENRMMNGGLHTWHSSFWYIFGALLCQGGVHLPDSMSGRTLISFWWLTCIIIVGTYCGNLIAFLTITKERPPFNNLQEMLKLKGTYKWGTLGGTSWETAFPSSSNPTFRAIGEAYLEFSKKDPSILDKSPKFHIERVKREKYAWIGDKTYIDISMATECDLVSIKEEFMPLIYVFGFPDNSPHTAVFSEQMIKIHEGGLLQIWKRKWWPKSNFCAGSTVPEAKPISLRDVQSAFYVCLVGVFLGAFAFVVEIFYHKCKRCLQNTEKLESNTDTWKETRANVQGDMNGNA